MDPEVTIARHMELLTELARVSNSGISLYDNISRRHVFNSYNFETLFGYDMAKAAELDAEYINTLIHPDDLPALERNGAAAREYLTAPERRDVLMRTKLISEYRMRRADGLYVKVIEQFQALEIAPDGALWLSLSVLDVSPDQSSGGGVQSRLMDCTTGEVWRLAEFDGAHTAALSGREKHILRMVRDGLLSKEIASRLAISVHTVNTHRQRILDKLGVDNSMEAVQYASRHGFLD